MVGFNFLSILDGMALLVLAFNQKLNRYLASTIGNHILCLDVLTSFHKCAKIYWIKRHISSHVIKIS